ncbi:cellulase family glycosylhydrolase [Vibrio penaeicida]|uniref:Glycoside hydrolase family 5 domain-containing protein n=1 Tax=Vibrio penaeicida TaxID=104609 RepID=A0AAV5NZ86_9VIBR|nr:cellulase family glycosylhydrolase [Vibrio penaeicida]RTZ22860.1 1,4-beta-xylanase [Vibrio penaeicida]GLQ75868.1 hypothetical protein GCM10007932_52310 [Vibrio penaeicida]
MEDERKLERWSKEKVNKWWKSQPLLCGFNYLPRTAVNWNEMWSENTFDLPTIEQELSWAKHVGFNCVRTNLPFLEWQKDSKALLSRVDDFLAVCARFELKVILTLLDDCEFGGEPGHTGIQKAPIPRVHNSRGVGSPGRNMVMDTSKWLFIERYVTDIIAQFSDDQRVIMWDLYNEPTNRMIFTQFGEFEFTEELEQYSQSLAKYCFQWARQVSPEQPLTIGAWHVPTDNAGETAYLHPTDKMCLELSDVITFHAYVNPQEMQKIVQRLAVLDRPMYCTEWLARHCDSNYASILPIMQKYSVGVMQWGLVRGKIQTSLPWPSIEVNQDDESLWFHDFLDEMGHPYSEEEVDLVRQFSFGSHCDEAP